MNDSVKISLTDLLLEIGNDNLKFQMLPASLDGNQQTMKGGKGSRLSFVTDERLANITLLNRRIAFVVWVDRDLANQAMKKLGLT